MRKLELKRRLRSAVVPTDPGEVKALLRQLAEPITLFGEREVTHKHKQPHWQQWQQAIASQPDPASS